MTYVLDPSVALKVILPEADSARAIRLRDEYANGTHTLLAPDHFTAELAKGLVAAERQGRIKPCECSVLLCDLLLNASTIFPSNLCEPAHQIACRFVVSA
jgi:predicted nucleic acid-binding protein